MDFEKTFLTDVLFEEKYSDIIERNLHTGPHYTMVFPYHGQLYRIQYIEGRDGEPRWLSKANSTMAECEAVKQVTRTVKVVGYEPVTDIDIPITTPMLLDYH